MAARGFRGRGRGRRGGAGRGLAPTAVDEDGKLLTDQISGPPATFPEMEEMPSVPEITEQDQRLLDGWHRLRHAYQTGPFHLQNKETKG
ncbi:unnamed protein product [Ostreobium quekettii]|uniref:Uncharacterized protein n=1 Tax=Ostreobium quekettii TaxID=121088 RepID=A0A8S1JGG0_9CHLO|nr:unnamed protein product [Ostreobium quekettii]